MIYNEQKKQTKNQTEFYDKKKIRVSCSIRKHLTEILAIIKGFEDYYASDTINANTNDNESITQNWKELNDHKKELKWIL